MKRSRWVLWLLFFGACSAPASPGPSPGVNPRYVTPYLSYSQQQPRYLVSGTACPGAEVVRAALQVDADGRTRKVELLLRAQDPVFNQAVIAALGSYQYHPKIVDWRPTPFTTALQFVLHRQQCRGPIIDYSQPHLSPQPMLRRPKVLVPNTQAPAFGGVVPAGRASAETQPDTVIQRQD